MDRKLGAGPSGKPSQIMVNLIIGLSREANSTNITQWHKERVQGRDGGRSGRGQVKDANVITR